MLAVITATYNSTATLSCSLKSISEFSNEIKQIFVDGGSSDGTLSMLQTYTACRSNSRVVAQDGSGLYQALNQGIGLAIKDSDVTHIGFLHSDDCLISAKFKNYLSVIRSSNFPVYYSDIQFHDESGRCVRNWVAGRFTRFKLNTGWMPPHTSMIVSKSVYGELGLYDPKFGTASDYEWIVRVLSNYGEGAHYFPEMTLSMLVGGASNASLKARMRANAMDGKVWARKSKLQSLLVRVCKPARKLGQFKIV